MTSLILIVGAGVAVLLAALLFRRSGRGSSPDLGTVSTTWLSEQRLGPGRDR